MKKTKAKSGGAAVAEPPAQLERIDHSLVINQRAELVDVSKIFPHPQNPRHGDIGALIELIKANGFYGHLIVQLSTGYILVGNHRFQAALALKMTHVPVTYVDVDDAKALKILLSDNRSSDLADYDNNALIELLQQNGLEGTGYDGDALDQLLADIGDEAITTDKDGTPDRKGAKPVVAYNIIFDDETQQRSWFEFLRGLKELYPDETTGSRLVLYIREHPLTEEG